MKPSLKLSKLVGFVSLNTRRGPCRLLKGVITDNESFFKLDAIGGGLENYMSDLFQLGIICGIDLVPITVRECIQEIISSVSGFSLVIKEGVQLPLRPLFVTQNIDEECDETKLRNRLHNQLHLYRLCLHAANCDVLLVKHYLLALQKNLKKTEIQVSKCPRFNFSRHIFEKKIRICQIWMHSQSSKVSLYRIMRL